MAIGTPVDLGKTASTSATSLAIASTLNAVSTGDCIFVFHEGATVANIITSVTDSSGNTYVAGQLQSEANAPLTEMWICPNAISMASASTITVNFNGTATRHGIAILKCAGINATKPNDSKVYATQHESSSVTTSTITCSGAPIFASELMWGVGSNNTTTSAWIPGGSWTAVGGQYSIATVATFFQIVSSPGALTFNPSWTTPVNPARVTIFGLTGDRTGAKGVRNTLLGAG